MVCIGSPTGQNFMKPDAGIETQVPDLMAMLNRYSQNFMKPNPAL